MPQESEVHDVEAEVEKSSHRGQLIPHKPAELMLLGFGLPKLSRRQVRGFSRRQNYMRIVLALDLRDARLSVIEHVVIDHGRGLAMLVDRFYVRRFKRQELGSVH
ncbi:MAG TPA: hypothetical protein VNA66_07240 [Gammaproteobacteria bacterium]|nr:hypothetical protein [Gammaproteobacteria bacterium]